MLQKITTKQRRSKRVARIRAVVQGNSERPRLAIFRSHTALYGQLIDDGKGITLTTIKQEGTNKSAGSTLGKAVAAFCKEKKIAALVFDRGGEKYHGVIKEIADAARQGGVTI